MYGNNFISQQRSESSCEIDSEVFSDFIQLNFYSSIEYTHKKISKQLLVLVID